MIDVHSHILPGIDDGAQTLEEALTLLRLAVDNGVTTQVLTPHIQPGRYLNDPGSLRKAFADFEHIVRQEGIPINLLLSAEVRIGPEVMALMQHEDFPWLGTWEGRRVFLLEMPHNHIPLGSLNLIDWLIDRDILPVIVHPERNRELQLDMHKLMPFIEAGCAIQLTASSLAGNFGQKAKTVAIELLQAGQVLFMATDCHNTAYRPPDLKAGLIMASELIGEVKATALVKDNPAQLLSLEI
ncbi:tyrosine-protein phosphatase [Sulfuriflexus mobilis]|uniref:tyrosine-protein phosphatase n=1 Tax=Sulfuriflexus mobilis TaxID=1811807 RepID=UPI000F8337EE|nr:CpsB/CapC family capsule biosynthesis tyrosine phosphatase [Sulfuriflexus mobilis]